MSRENHWSGTEEFGVNDIDLTYGYWAYIKYLRHKLLGDEIATHRFSMFAMTGDVDLNCLEKIMWGKDSFLMGYRICYRSGISWAGGGWFVYLTNG